MFLRNNKGGVFLKKGLFIKNGMIMSASSLIIRALSLFSGVYLSGRIGTAGLGLYSLIVSVYLFFASVISSGATLVCTRLTSEYISSGNNARARYSATRCIIFTMLFSGTVSVLCFVFGDNIASGFLGDMRCASPIKILSFSLPFLAFSSCIRGYFTAKRQSIQSCSEQILEMITEIGVFVLLFETAKPSTLETGCICIVTGTLFAEIISFIYMLLLFLPDIRRLSRDSEKAPGLFSASMRIALPASGNAMLRTGLSAVENVLIPSGLSAFGAGAVALSQYGIITAQTLPVLTFPAVFIQPFAQLIIPEMAEANVRRDKKSIKRMTEKMLSYTLRYSIPVMVCCIFFAVPVCRLLYGNDEAGIYLSRLAPVIPFMYIDSVADGMLKGLDRQTSYLVFNLIDSVIRVILTYLLLPVFGINGEIAVIIISELLNTSMSVIKLIRVTEIELGIFKNIVLPIIEIVVPCIVSRLLFSSLRGELWDICRLLLCIGCYVLFELRKKPFVSQKKKDSPDVKKLRLPTVIRLP